MWKWEQRAPASPARSPWTPGANKREGRDANDESGNNRERLGEPLCGPPAGPFTGRTEGGGVGGGACGRRKKGTKSRGRGDSERARRYRETEKEGREWHRSLCSLNEVFFLFFCVCVVALGVDDGCVGVRRVVRPFGLVCQVRSWGSGGKKIKNTNQQSFIGEKNNKRRAGRRGF